MDVKFKKVTTDEKIDLLADIADEIWHEYWPDRIGLAQTDYMVDLYQSADALKRDIESANYEYWLIAVTDDDETERIVGYTGGHVEADTNRFFISKIYLFAEERGHGFCTKAIDFYEKLCRERGLDAMYLTVNKDNDIAIRAYLGTGFKTIDASVKDIGGGFVMDDYIMERAVSTTDAKRGVTPIGTIKIDAEND